MLYDAAIEQFSGPLLRNARASAAFFKAREECRAHTDVFEPAVRTADEFLEASTLIEARALARRLHENYAAGARAIAEGSKS
jgi:hypothetical protein